MATGARNFVGFYWTLPVPRVGFTALPENADAAAAVSRTIRYQRDLVRHHVQTEAHGRLLAEYVWLEVSFDRGSAFVDHLLDKAFAACRAHDATLLFVDFSQRSGWRSHRHMRQRLEDAMIQCIGLEPPPVAGEAFDPIQHFEDWQRRLDVFRAARPSPEELRQALLGLLAPYLPPEAKVADYASAAAFLNVEGILTRTGRRWTRDNLRMFLRPPPEIMAPHSR